MEVKVRKLTGWFEKAAGLMGKESPEPVLLPTRFGIHTFFMRFSIDVVILDEKNYVKVMRERLLPYRFFVWNPLYFTALELPPGTIRRLGIKKGEQLTVTFV